MRRMVYWLVVVLVALGCLWLPVPFLLQFVAASLLAFFIPGWLLVQIMDLRELDSLERIVVAIGASYGLVVLGALATLYVFGQLSWSGIIEWLSVTTLILIVSYSWQLRKTATVIRNEAHKLTRQDIAYFSIPVIVTTFFSFTNVAYADYWGDEMNGLLRAISIIGGRVETIFEHTKGPVEIMLPGVFGLLTEQFAPFVLRFPFAVAYIVGVGTYYLLSKRFFGRNVALFATLIFLINGIYLAYARIVQYQAIVLLMIVVAVLLGYLFYKSGRGIYLVLSTFCVGVGALGHYDAFMALFPVGYLVWRRYGWQWPSWRENWLKVVGAGIILLIIVLAFYIPFLLHPHITKTASYLTRIIGVADWPSNNFDELYMFMAAYNSSYYLVFIAFLGLSKITVDLIKLWRDKGKNKRFAVMVIAIFCFTLLLMITDFARFGPMLIFILLFTLLISFSITSTELKTVYVWAGIPFVFYVFFIDHPRNHLQIIFLGWSLLAALGGKQIFDFFQSRLPIRKNISITIGVVIFAILFGLFAAYQYLLYVDSQTEYIFTYPAKKTPLYWEDPDFPFGSRRLYGAPHRLGWQKINELYLQGYFKGDWNSNDEGSNLFWYTLGAPRNPCYPHYYFLTQFEQKPDSNTNLPDLTKRGYVKIGEVWNRDRLQIEVFEFAPLGRDDEVQIWTEPERYASFVTPADFNGDPYEKTGFTPEQISNALVPQPIFKPHPEMLKQVAEQYQDSRINNVRDKIALLGNDLDETWAQSGGALMVTFYWQAVDIVNLPYKVAVHLEDRRESSQVWSQADDFPACGTQLTYHWPVGDIIADTHMLKLPDDLPVGEYVIRIGLYEPETGLHLDVLDEMGNPAGIDLTLISVHLPATSQ